METLNASIRKTSAADCSGSSRVVQPGPGAVAWLCFGMAVLVIWCGRGLAQAVQTPSREGLVLWLDASNASSVKTNAQGRVTFWGDLSGHKHDLVGAKDLQTLPQVELKAMNDKPVVRFAGGQYLQAETAVRQAPGSATVIVVSQRLPGQASKDQWQRLLSCVSDSSKLDNQSPNFHLMADEKGDGGAYEAIIYHLEKSAVPIGVVELGRSPGEKANYFKGDIAEVLLYDRGFLSEAELHVVLDYLHAKWNASIPTSGWTRNGPLGTTPVRVRNDLPLSDQKNEGKWVLDTKFTDEFEGPALDMKRWNDQEESWRGREPAYFSRGNVKVVNPDGKDGMLQLAFRKENLPEMKDLKGYKDYTSAYVKTRDRTGYGYYEIEAQPMNSAGSSAFWFWNTGLPDNATEIDVFEIGAKGKNWERKYNMNAHVFKTPQSDQHWAVGRGWEATWNLGEEYHVFGFEWNKKKLTWYVDGVPVRRADNTNWHFPMWLVFDSEAFWGWFGKVNDADLPSFFNIKYVRVWRQGEPSR